MKGYGDNFGVGNQDSYSVLEIAKEFGTEIEFLEERKGNRMTASIDTSKTELLGWEAKTGILDHIRKFIGLS